MAIVGSGPAGLTAAWQLARQGYKVKIFEAAAKPGGFLRLAIPAYRLPPEVVDQDIGNVTALGRRDRDQLADHRRRGAPRATATRRYCSPPARQRSTPLGVDGDGAEGVMTGVDFLRAVKLGEALDLHGKDVVVVGGGNVAMDSARTARRLGAASVTVAYRRGRD